MEQLSQEIRREYRLNFDKGEPAWDDPIAPEVTSEVLGRSTDTIINRTSLLAWSLMKLPHVEVADLVGGGWIEIRVETGADFDELTLKFQIADIVAEIREIRPYRLNNPRRRHGVRNVAATLINPPTARPLLRGLPPTLPMER